MQVVFYVGVQLAMDIVDSAGDENVGMTPYMKQLGAVGAVKVAVRSLQGSGLRRSFKKNSEEWVIHALACSRPHPATPHQHLSLGGGSLPLNIFISTFQAVPLFSMMGQV